MSKDDDLKITSKREQKLDNPHNRKGSTRGKGRRAKRAANHGTAINKYANMGVGDKEKAKEEGFNSDLISEGGGYWIYGKVRFENIQFADDGYTRGELEGLYPQIRTISDFCRIQKEERYSLVSREIERHYVHIKSGGIVSAVMAEGQRVSNKTFLEDFLPGVQEYNSARDKF